MLAVSLLSCLAEELATMFVDYHVHKRTVKSVYLGNLGKGLGSGASMGAWLFGHPIFVVTLSSLFLKLLTKIQSWPGLKHNIQGIYK